MLYTIGYARLTPRALQARVERFDCLLVDVRGSPFSRKPGFSGTALAHQFGERYLFAGQILGNKNGHAVTEAGIAYLRQFDGSAERHAMLMCLEEEAWECHRHLLICGPHFPNALHLVGRDLLFAGDVEASLESGEPFPVVGELPDE